MSARFRGRPRAASTVLALALSMGFVAAMTACATIPSTGVVVVGGSIANLGNNIPARYNYIANSPTAGESQADILLGFVEAADSPDNDYQVARQYLSPQFAAEWNPDASVTIDEGGSRASAKTLNSTEQQLQINPVAFVDGQGDYTAADSTAPINLQYSFVKVDGQWRIAKAPAGIVIDSLQFSHIFSQYPLYFFSPDFRFLVPDERWFPSTSNSISTRIVQALLSGPSKWLAGSVATAFPAGTSLSNGAVPTQSGVAQVALSSVASNADSTTLARMDQQLVESLTSSASVTSVALSIDGLARSGLAPSNAVRDPGIDADPIVVQAGTLGVLSGSTVVTLPTLGASIGRLHPQSVTLSADRQTAAVLAAGMVYAVRGGRGTTDPVDSRPALVAPSLDEQGDVWSVPNASPDSFQVSPPTGKPYAVTASWPNARSILAIAISRDGTRLAALVRVTNEQTHVMVAGIVRPASTGPLKLGTPVDLGTAGAAYGTAGVAYGQSLAWVDEVTIAVIGDSPAGQGQSPQQTAALLGTQIIGGIGQTQSAPTNASVVVGGNSNPDPVWVLQTNGELVAPRGPGWQSRGSNISAVAVQLGLPGD